ATRVDGNDPEAVADATAEIVQRIRAGGGPEFLQLITYRQRGHTSFDQAAYRPAGEAARETETNDPIERQKEALRTAGVTEADLTAIHDAAMAEMAVALADAAATPFPDDATVFDDVQDIGSPAAEAY
ncbi:MAG: thiamine pyrophosphate-dependent enzyme, partial [Rhodospirillaceae bacterium]